MSPAPARLAVRVLLVSLVAASGALAAPTGEPVPPAARQPSLVEQRWGIRPVALRLTAGGTMVDFRYQVVDAARARALFDKKLKPYLLDPRTGIAMESPDATKLGPLRSSARNPPVAGKQYFVLFANGLGVFKKSDRLTVVLGDCRLENLLLD
jgi:hypothetical protein